ncbi:hypothetical protein GCM10022422_44590 [Flavobacterium ginsengisoli]|uniref:Sulfate ABC transporter permease n=1 Tax=Flavobacterium ginsengisoli TaxID=871694 RepID=A0ABP7G3T0_9FLAO|nr:hypothetical protein [Flavobacterium ginsengisoli]
MKFPFIKWFLLSIATILITEIFKNSIKFEDLLYNFLSVQLNVKQVENFITFQRKWQWFSNLFIPFLLLLKIFVVSIILYIGLFFCNKDLKFNTILNFVLKAEFIFLLVPICKIIWFYFFQTTYTLEDIQYFYPFSALNIVGYKGLENWFIYPFQVLNLFELFYVIYLGYEIGKLTDTNTDYGLKVISISYLPSLFIWVATIMFFTLNYS